MIAPPPPSSIWVPREEGCPNPLNIDNTPRGFNTPQPFLKRKTSSRKLPSLTRGEPSLPSAGGIYCRNPSPHRASLRTPDSWRAIGPFCPRVGQTKYLLEISIASLFTEGKLTLFFAVALATGKNRAQNAPLAAWGWGESVNPLRLLARHSRGFEGKA